MEQLSLLDLLSKLEALEISDSEAEDILDNELPFIRENLLIETIRSAFGESRGGRKRKPSDEAWEWILSEEGAMPFSFKQCCLACGVDPETILESLLYYKRKFTS